MMRREDPARRRAGRTGSVVLGLAENWQQFSLLVLVSALVGGMVGLERVVLPAVASADYGVASTSAALSFIATFGLAKAFTNLAAGWLVDRRGRRWTLIVGWLIALPVPLLIWAAPNWWWIVAANALLGVNQGLTWSTTVIMKIDLVGPRRRGLAMGLNEFAGYVAVALAALASGVIATRTSLRAGPVVLGLAIATAGLLLSLMLVRDTGAHAKLEDAQHPDAAGAAPGIRPLLTRSLWSDARLFSTSQAGLVNNLNDGLAWGLFPLLFLGADLSLRDTSLLAALYPFTWGIAQVWTGGLSDRFGRKGFIVGGMVLQGAALLGMAVWSGFAPWAAALIALGIGTALVYPTLLAAVGDAVRPASRAAAVGVYRLWRDLGYVAGALLAGILADIMGMSATIAVIGFLTVLSGVVVQLRLDERPLPNPPRLPPVLQEPVTGVR
jgi:MFS family permease